MQILVHSDWRHIESLHFKVFVFVIGQQQLLIYVWIELLIHSPIFREQHSCPESPVTSDIFVLMCVVLVST